MQTRPLYLHGRWDDGDGEPYDVINPANGRAIARVATVGRAVVAEALATAEAACDPWRDTAARDRGALLRRVADAIASRGEAVARTLTLENGKPIGQSRAEVAASVDHLRWFAEAGRRAYGRVVPHQAEGKRHLVLKRPVGVVAAITPWNFPLMLACRKVGPAWAAGCPVVLKPSELTPLSALALAEAVHEAVGDAGAPPGVFQLVLGDAAAIGAAFLSNPIVKKLTFTGSTAVGKTLIAGAAETVTKLSLELGGQAPLLVFDDAGLDDAVDAAYGTKFRNGGQSCIASNRFFVQAGVHDTFVERLAAKVRAMTVGDGSDEATDLGPLINAAGVDKAKRHVDDALRRGATLVAGGPDALDALRRRLPDGHFFPPTLLTGVPGDALCMTEETFGPVIPIARFDDEADAIARANATPFGLSAYAYTNDLRRAWRLAERLDAGTVAINDDVPSTSIAPFGGTGQSGWGRELGEEGLDAFLETKHVSLGGMG